MVEEKKKKENDLPKVYSPDLKTASREEKDAFIKILDHHFPPNETDTALATATA